MRELLIITKVEIEILKNKLLSYKRHSAFKIVAVAFMLAGLLGGGFLFFYEGFSHLNMIPGIGPFIMDRILYLFFMALFFLLIFSSIAIGYTTLYRSDEMDFLYSLPLSTYSIFTTKFNETIFLSSWALVLLGGPILFAYGVVKETTLNFYVVILLYYVLFSVVACGIGAAVLVLTMRFIPKRRIRNFGIGLIVAVSLLAIWALKYERIIELRGEGGLLNLALNQLIPNLWFYQLPFLPHYWVTEGLLSMIKGVYGRCLFFLLVTLSNAMFIYTACFLLAKRIFYDSWLFSKGPIRTKRYPLNKGLLNKLPLWGLLPSPIRSMAVKDVKTFWRDPSQWIQFTVFFGLLAVYYSNLRNLRYDVIAPQWKNVISFLNLGSTSLVLASLSTRFIFPLVSLEGRRLWIAKLSPLSLKDIMLEKFWLSISTTLLITEILMVLSSINLRVEPAVTALSIFTIFLMNFGLVGLAIGLGSLYPDFEETNPAKIVSGFGGTLTFVLSLVYIGAIIVIESGPIHLYFVKGAINIVEFRLYLLLVVAAIFIVTGLFFTIPFLLGLRNLKHLEL